jgi:hypothetical protein
MIAAPINIPHFIALITSCSEKWNRKPMDAGFQFSVFSRNGGD